MRTEMTVITGRLARCDQRGAATVRLLRDKELRRQLCTGAAASVSRLSIASCVDSHLALYRKYAGGT